MRTHGYAANGRSSEYRSWQNMLTRCNNPKTNRYSFYRGKGITVCEQWLKFENFLRDMGLKPDPSYTIERINNEGNYEPLNCRWASPAEQNRNVSRNRNLTLNGVTKCMTDWAHETGMSVFTLYKRLKRGMDLQEALSKPLRKQQVQRLEQR